jgi:Rrf2 family transcriptional regulator, cysteine metabolism repressor
VTGTRLASVLTITTKSPYAVRALTELARRGEGEPVPIGEIAKARDIPVQFLEGLFATLRRAGILQSQRGVKGGYLFARPPAEVTVLEVTELLDGELGSGPGAADQIWTEATGALKSVLRDTSIADLVAREAEANPPMYYI